MNWLVGRVLARARSTCTGVWDLFPAALQQRYQPVRARLSDVGPERIRQMDAAAVKSYSGMFL
ncbi:MAG TPA: hypothetical protein VGG53_11995 [Mycobacterium sp.]|jgi:hypothetical protein|uniref:hypothetical protein n=1 Tax=Mycobacterium sp. TaxID=1785 RepID=UPI002F41A8F4